MPNVYDKKSASKALKISVETIDRLRKTGKLPYHRIGDRILFTEADLTSFLENCVVPASNPLTVREQQNLARASAKEATHESA